MINSLVKVSSCAKGSDITAIGTATNVEYYDQYIDMFTGTTAKTQLPAFQDTTDQAAVTLTATGTSEYCCTITASGTTKWTDPIATGIDYKTNDQADGGVDTYALTLYKLTN